MINIVDIVSCHQGNIQLAAHSYKLLIYLLQLRNGVFLYFQVEITKGLLIPQSSLLCLVESPLQNKARNFATETGRKGNKTLMMMLKKLFIHPRFIVKALKVRFSGELD